ncbi:hypothetical protein BGZ47_002900 [Haplosporangium gracile]|nr:hypothetical protein BGZ47_002900 [Haplosporangium gracile]
MTTDDNRDTPIASPASSMAVQTLTSLANSSPVPHTTAVAYNKTATACTATSTTTNNNYSSNPIMQTPTRQKSAKDRVVKREQRRHSSDDGLAFYRRSASSSPPTSCIVDNINNNKYAIPPKCRMVFHMRDEVPRPREEDKTELSEKRFYQYRPQPQPRVRIRSLYSSSDQGQEKGSMLSPLTSTSTPMKKPNSGKCAKMVSFKEPESWRDVTPPPPSHQPPSSLSSSAETEKQGDPHDTKQVRMLLTRLNIPTIMVTEPQQQKQSTSASASASTSTPTAVRRPMSEPILSGGSTVLSTSSPLSSSSSPSSSAHRHIQATRATSPPRFSSASSPSLSSSADGPLSSTTSRHHRSLSMTVQSTFSSPSSNVPRRMQAGQGPMVEESKTKSGNKFLRLWRSATQKYGNHHHHSHQSNGGVGFLGGKGSDLEPLVSMARE